MPAKEETQKGRTKWTAKNKALDRYSSRSRRPVASRLFSASFGWRPAGKSPASDRHLPVVITAVRKRRRFPSPAPFVTRRRRRLRQRRLVAADSNILSGRGSAPIKTMEQLMASTTTMTIPCPPMIGNCWTSASRRIKIEWP